jgi:class 3 adenylate cyclase/tetratricopeptide (TPR) repeat protein
MMAEREELERAIQQLQDLRGNLGDAAVEAALAGIYQRLSALDESESQDQASAVPGEHRGERRVVTVLFCDVAGSTSLAEGMDPEAWSEIMNTTFEYLIEPVERYGGTVARLMGDAILAFFGAPTAHEDDPQRAVMAGLDILEGISPFREKLRSERGLDYNVRVGINTGLVVVGDVGSETAGEYTAMGDAVNVAARMEQTAAPGAVQISQDTYTLVAPLFDFRELGGIPVKGKRKPVLAYQVMGVKAEPGSLRGLSDQGISSPLVGRQAEFETARVAFDQLFIGLGGILVVLGEAGIGKSRLINELRQTALSADNSSNQPGPSPASILWLEGQPLSYSQTISYWPFQQILRQYASIDDDDDESIALKKLEIKIQQLFPAEAVEILPYLASLLSLEISGEYSERVKYLNAEALKSQVYRASRRFFQRLAEQSPLVLLFDDLHWMDASSAELLEHLMPLVEMVPMLICALSRPAAESPTANLVAQTEEQFKDHLTLISLAPLAPNDSRRLVQNLLAVDDLPEQARQMILDKADGNPFYLEEIVRDLIEKGALVQDEPTGRWRATKLIAEVTVPDTIQGLLIARIDRLDEHLKQVVRQAAVIGRAFLYRILNAIVDDAPDLDQQLDQLQRVELIQEQQRIPELEYIFKHALAQEAAYDSILLQERRKAHAKVGAAIETQMADRLDEFYGLLAYHYSAAEEWERAQEYLFKAGDQAGRMAADAEALAHYRKAMEAYALVRGDDWDPLERAQLERKIGEALFRLGEHEQAQAYLERALAFLGEGLPATRWGTRLAIVHAILIQIGHRFISRRLVRSMKGSPNPATEEIFLISLALSWVEVFHDIERYLLVSIKVLNSSERGGFAYGSAYLASNMATGLDLLGRRSLAERYFRIATDYSQQMVPYRPVYLLELSLAIHYNFRGNAEKSLKHSNLASEIAQSTGDLRGWGSARDLVAWAQHTQCKLSDAVTTWLEMISVGEEGSDRQVICWGFSGLGTTQRRLGQLDEAIDNLQRSIEIAQELPDYRTQVTAGAWLGRCYLAKGELEQAFMVLETSQEASSAPGAVGTFATYLYNGLSEAYLLAAENSTGKTRQEWLKKAKKTCRKNLKPAKNSRIPLPEALMFQGRYEWLRGKPAVAEKWWRQALEAAQNINDPFMEAALLLEMGQQLGDCDYLQRAESILEVIGAEFDLKLVREALANLRGN